MCVLIADRPTYDFFVIYAEVPMVPPSTNNVYVDKLRYKYLPLRP